MNKKIVCITLCLLLVFPLVGCWNYRGLNEMSIVSGVAIDRNPLNGYFQLTFETVDLSKPIKSAGLVSKIIQTEGKTLFDAARNAKTRVQSKLYYGNMQIVVVSREIAETEGVEDIIDWFLRDSECRETMCFIISQEKTAHDILSIEGSNNSIVAEEIQKIINTDQEITSSTADVELYKIYNILRGEGLSLTLPAVHTVINDKEPATEINGIAIFKGEKLKGFLTPEQSKYLLFATDHVNGGVLTCSSTNLGPDNVSLEISENKTKQSYSYEDGKIKIKIKTDTIVFLNEMLSKLDALDKDQIAVIEKSASDALKKNMRLVIEEIQTNFKSDALGFGNMIYRKDPKLWSQLSNNWDILFPTLEVEIDSKVKIVNSAAIKKS